MANRLSTLALIVCLSGILSVTAAAQVTVSIQDEPLAEALSQLEKASGYNFFYSSTLPGKDARVSVEATDWSIGKVLDTMLAGLDIAYEIRDDRQIILTVKEDKTLETTPPGVFLKTAALRSAVQSRTRTESR